ncbi:MAG: hypothetical protein WAO83_05850 [Fuerstiella sp.]
MAAAIVLSEPAFGYASQWTAAQLLHNGNLFDVMEVAAVEYRRQLNGRSSEFAAKAVRDAPGNPELSRIQAMLLFPYSYGSTKTNHCENPNWLNILKSARSHDPDNALYDYLIAAHAWSQSTDIAFKNDPFMSCEVVNDPELHELAARHFHAGLACRMLRFPDSEMQLVLQFCKRVGLQREASRIACCSGFELESSALLRSLSRELNAQADAARLISDPEHLTAVGLQQRTLSEQLEAGDQASVSVHLRVLTAQAEATFRQVEIAYPELVADRSLTTRERLNYTFERDRQVETETSLRLLKRFNIDAAKKNDGLAIANAVRPIIYGTFLLFISVGTFLLQRRIRNDQTPNKIGRLTSACFLISLVAWTVGLAILPSGLVKGGIPGSAFIIGTEMLLVGGLIWLARWFLRRRKVPELPSTVRLRFLLPFVAFFVLFLQAVLWSIKLWIDDQFKPQESGFATLTIPTNRSLPEWAKAIVYCEHNHVLGISLVTGTILTIAFVSLLSWRWKKKTRASLLLSLKYFCGACCAAFQRPALASGLILCSIGFASTSSAIDNSLAWDQYRELWCDRDAKKNIESTIRAEVIDDQQFMKTAETAALAYSTRIAPDMEDCYLRPDPVSLEPDEGGYGGGTLSPCNRGVVRHKSE